MQLRQPEPLGMLDNHDGRVGHIHPHLDHGRRHQYLRIVAAKPFHRFSFCRRRHLAVHQHHLVAEHLLQLGKPVLGRHHLEVLALLHQRADPERLRPLGNPRLQPLHHPPVLTDRKHSRINRLPPARLVADDRHGHVAKVRQHQRPRDRRRRHHQQVGVYPLLRQRQSLMHPKPMLLVDDGQPQVVELHTALEQRMRPDGNGALPRLQPRQRRPPIPRRHLPGQQFDPEPHLHADRCQRPKVLICQQFRRRHHHRLGAAFGHGRHRHQRHHGLAGPHVTLHQPRHPLRRGKVGENVLDRQPLPLGERIGKGGRHRSGDQPIEPARNPAWGDQLRPYDQQRQLPRQVLVIGEPHPGRRPELPIIRRLRLVRQVHRLEKARPFEVGECLRRPPFRQLGQRPEHLSRQLGERPRAQPLRQRVDRLHQRHLVELVRLDHVVRVGDLLFAVEKANRPRDIPVLANRQQFLHPAALRPEIDQLDLPGLVMREHPVRHPGPTARRRQMPIDMQLQRRHLVVECPRNPIHPPPVNHPGRHMHEQIKRNRLLPLGRPKEAGQQGR